ncbi:uncharacterized protein LOC113357709 isoform X4 [Papaver somniferum]|uniref:uncharacterized protein LOC113357709 isoform X4 n=1 Tax=Papaver somniferum TaxID=3469 RepID=UPI000E7000D0|nr:uncharacterized protein LOC113357709 isoform X4 [Papaver somniferum]
MNKMKDAGTSKREHAVMENIKEAHRRVMVANHPHKGGSMYLAKKINEAEGVLLGLTDVDDPIPRSSNGLSEEISFKILKQVVEVEQAAMWKFLWWSGIIPVHVMVGQNIDDHSEGLILVVATI